MLYIVFHVKSKLWFFVRDKHFKRVAALLENIPCPSMDEPCFNRRTFDVQWQVNVPCDLCFLMNHLLLTTPRFCHTFLILTYKTGFHLIGGPLCLVFMRFLYPCKLEFGVLVFVEGGKQNTKEYLGVMQEPTTNATHIWQQARIEPGSHWWEVSTLTTASSLLLKKCDWFSVNQRNTNHSTPWGSKQTNLFLITKERRSTLWIPPNTKFLLTTSIS